MGLTALVDRLRQSVGKILHGFSGVPDLEHFAFENHYRMMTLHCHETVTLDSPIVDNRHNSLLDLPKNADLFPMILDYHGDLTSPIHGRRVFYRNDPEMSAVFLDYQIHPVHKHKVILKLKGMNPQTMQISFDGREDNVLPILVFFTPGLGT